MLLLDARPPASLRLSVDLPSQLRSGVNSQAILITWGLSHLTGGVSRLGFFPASSQFVIPSRKSEAADTLGT
ncbi:hypothetical protein EDF62_1778 [Leucobacter luti]|uniref:Uncharacterized protein n=1 Tax=Leucobacter luti TaxID=340320 RepID=A0A4R6S043_9MICO|nr:hypothetical protein EDF62_1778 [Leucobacter luti]